MRWSLLDWQSLGGTARQRIALRRELTTRDPEQRVFLLGWRGCLWPRCQQDPHECRGCVRTENRATRVAGMLLSVNPLAFAAIDANIRRLFCGDYGVYSPTGWLARFQMGRIQSFPTASRCAQHPGAFVGTHGRARPSAKGSGHPDDSHRRGHPI